MTRNRWQKREEPAAHIDDWLMTYADMITLLLCFFAVFLSLAMVHKEHTPKPPPPPVEQPAPDIIQGSLPLHGLPYTAGPAGDDDIIDTAKKFGLLVMPVIVADTPPAPAADSANAQDAAASSMDDVVAPPPVAPAPVAANTAGDQPLADSLPQIIDRLKSQGPADIEEKGDRLTTIDINSAAFFDRGSATLSKAGQAVLRDVAVNIKSDKFKGYQITVEGHTDDTPIKTSQFPSNWELSTARAAAVVHFFLDQGVPAQRLRAAGYADTFPKAPNRDANGHAIPANQALNRRVVIKLEKIEKTE